MARTVDAAAHARRRDHFLDVAQQLIESKGYEQMSIQDVLNEAGTSRGAFYHYFGSKQELLSAVVDRFGAVMASVLEPTVSDPGLSAVDKLHQVFVELTARKDREREALVRTLRVWYSDGNARVRQKARVGIIDRLTRVLRDIVGQGLREGAFEIPDPDLTSRVLATLIQDLNDDLADQFFAYEARAVDMAAVERTVVAYTGAFERILGIPAGSIVVDMATFRAWFDPPVDGGLIGPR
jgi:AcrR family transcriptional regulator